MKASYTFLLATGLAAQQVAATWDLFGSPFKSPQYNQNECSDKQKTGFNWADLKDGDSNFSYGDFDFSKNWKAANSFGKRDVATKRSFGSKCIKNTISKQKPASFGCDKRKNGFSIREIDVSVEFDVDVEFHFIMGDGSKCKQVSPCSKSGSTVKNTQCGGAISVDIFLPKHEKSDKECEIGFHNIGFDCDAGRGYTPPASEAPTSETSSAPAVETPSTSTAVIMSPPYTNSSTSASAPHAVPKPPQTTVVTSKEESATAGPTPESSSATSPPAVESSTAMPCDGSNGSSCNGTSVAPPYSTGYPVAGNSSDSVAEPSSPPSLPPANPTEVLPKCMNTWLQIDSQCKDNTDSSCYCKNKDFTKNVIDCVSAWCGTDEETREALQYLIGICAEHVPENPGLVTDCPSYVPLNPPTPTAPSAPEGPDGGAMTTAAPGEKPGSEMPSTTITFGSTTLTMPQVHFTTQTNEAGTNPTAPVGLIPGTAPAQTPAETPASTTAADVPLPVESGTTLATVAPTTTRLGTGVGGSGPTRSAQGTSPPEFTGAAWALQVDAQHALLGMVVALFAL